MSAPPAYIVELLQRVPPLDVALDRELQRLPRNHPRHAVIERLWHQYKSEVEACARALGALDPAAHFYQGSLYLLVDSAMVLPESVEKALGERRTIAPRPRLRGEPRILENWLRWEILRHDGRLPTAALPDCFATFLSFLASGGSVDGEHGWITVWPMNMSYPPYSLIRMDEREPLK